MRDHLHSDTQLSLAIAEPQEWNGYVDTLLGLARAQTLARQAVICRELLREQDDTAPRNVAVGSRIKLH